MNFADLLSELFEALSVKPPDEVRRDMVSYLELLETWGRKTDLTGARDRKSLVELSCLDATELLRSRFVPNGSRILDVGAGAGAPALPFALLRADARLILVEPRRLRVAFLRTAVGALRIADRVKVIEAKLDPSTPWSGEALDCAWSRATFEPRTWIEFGQRLAPLVIAFVARERDTFAAGPDRHDYEVPSTRALRSIVRVGAAACDVPEPG